MKLFGVQLWGRNDPPDVRRAMEDHRYTYPRCEACGRMPVDIHHIIPVTVDPGKGADPFNLISLCPDVCHVAYGHGGDAGYHHYVPNVREVIKLRKVVKING